MALATSGPTKALPSPCKTRVVGDWGRRATLPSMNRDAYRSVNCIVSDERAFAYLPVAKVACSSIKTALLPLFPDVDPGPNFEREVRDGAFAYRVHDLFARSDHQMHRRRFLRGLHKGRYEGYFVFAFVRNPWDRLLSCWKQKLAPGGQGLKRTEYAGERLYLGMGFPEFVEAVCRIPDEDSNHHFRSQHVVVCSHYPEKRVLADFVGRYENLAEDFGRVAARIGLEAGLPHLLPSGRDAAYQEFYDRRLAALVGERYRLDAEIFGYSF